MRVATKLLWSWCFTYMEMLSNPPTHPGAPSQGTVGCGIRTTLLASLIGRDPSSTLVMVIQSYNHVCLGMKQRRGGRQAFMAEEDCSFLSRSKHEMSLVSQTNKSCTVLFQYILWKGSAKMNNPNVFLFDLSHNILWQSKCIMRCSVQHLPWFRIFYSEIFNLRVDDR